MGAGASTVNILANHNYLTDRKILREKLTTLFGQDPDNQDILKKINALQSIIIKNSHICTTAAKEFKNKDDHLPTNHESALRELERLYHIYETGRILKSAKFRTGPVACPLSHHMIKFVDHHHPSSKLPFCSVCHTKEVPSGFHCSYCSYDLCMKCSVIYCSLGHVMVLWTNPESMHACYICKEKSISGGYKCTICHDFDICDMCTYIPGRMYVRKEIFSKLEATLIFISEQKLESATAVRISNHYSVANVTANFDISTESIIKISNEIDQLKEIVIEEVMHTRIIKEVKRLRAVLLTGIKYSATAYRESLIPETYSQAEVDRLTIAYDADTFAKSVVARGRSIVACLLGHAMEQYRHEKEAPKLHKNITEVPPSCRVCDRFFDTGYHCRICEYYLCASCSIVYCQECHPMTMWTIPEASAQCALCSLAGLTLGYHCNICYIDTCDMCTHKSTRDMLRARWDKELIELLTFLNANKSLSDEAAYYDWRQKNYIVSPALLCNNVLELRTAKAIALKQIKYKPIIDKIKILRRMLLAQTQGQSPTMCKMAVEEAKKDNKCRFSSKKEAKAELRRLMNIESQCGVSKTIKFRLVSKIACPLCHGMVPLIDPQSSSLPPSPPTHGLGLRPIGNPIDSMETHETCFKHSPMCSVCDDLITAPGGNSCTICDYDLCSSCSVIYCRRGHPTQIWTLPEAEGLHCDLCHVGGITAGYRCLDCNVDYCDSCTNKESRDALKQWPMQELKGLMKYFELSASGSELARKIIDQQKFDKEKKYLRSMSALCTHLQMCKAVKEKMEVESMLNRSKFHKESYIRTCRDA